MSTGTPNNFGKVKKRWRTANPPDANGNYICWLCLKPVSADLVTLDHVAPLAQYPEYAKELSNLRPSHNFCNEQRAQPWHSNMLKRFGNHQNRHRGYRGIKV